MPASDLGNERAQCDVEEQHCCHTGSYGRVGRYGVVVPVSVKGMMCCALISSQPGHQRGSKQRRDQLQADDGQQVPGPVSHRFEIPVGIVMRVASRCTAHQNQPMEGNHEKSAAHDTLKRGHMAVLPDMDGARHADSRQDHHQRTQPSAVLVLEGKPHVYATGSCDDSRAQPGMEDGPPGSGPSCQYRGGSLSHGSGCRSRCRHGSH